MPLERREADKTDWVLLAADFLERHLTPEGRVDIRDGQYPESHIYLAGSLFPLLEAHQLSGDGKYLTAARRILDYFRRHQRSEGGWTSGYAAAGGERTATLAGYGSYRELADRLSASIPGWPLEAVRKYERTTGDPSYPPMAERAIQYLTGIWNDHWGFDDGSSGRPSRTFWASWACPCGGATIRMWSRFWPGSRKARAGGDKRTAAGCLRLAESDASWWREP